jgi:hypothetical protein
VVSSDGVDRFERRGEHDGRACGSPGGPARPSDKRRSVMRNERVRLQPYVDAPLAKQLAAYNAATGKTTRFVVQAALRQYLDRTDDKMLLLGQINRLRRAWEHTQRDLELFMERGSPST